MTRASCAGFTLLELLLAMTLSAIVLVGAVTALNSLAEANARVTQRVDESIGIERALRLVRRDVRWATSYTLTGKQLVLVGAGGSAVVYDATLAGDELHRVTGASQATALVAIAALGLGGVTAPVFTTRGHLRDADYRASAVLQGVRGIRWDEIARPGSAEKIGLKLTIDRTSEAGLQSCSAVALLLAKVAPDASKP